MGSIMSDLMDEYRDYVRWCEERGIDAWGWRDRRGAFWEHWDQLKKDPQYDILRQP